MTFGTQEENMEKETAYLIDGWFRQGVFCANYDIIGNRSTCPYRDGEARKTLQTIQEGKHK